MKKFLINKNYMYSDIVKEYNKGNNSFYEFGNKNNVGEGFIVIKNQDKDLTTSFMLASASKNGYVYTCIYNDVK
jgi:hypothetical protein